MLTFAQFILLQEAVGKVVVTDGVEERVLFLDCTGNSDISMSSHQSLLDARCIDFCHSELHIA